MTLPLGAAKGSGGLADQLIEWLVERVVEGEYPVGGRLPSEAEIAEETGVSRLTVREAIRALREKGVVRIVHGRGTFVNPSNEWSPLDAMLLSARSGSDDFQGLARSLTEARTVVESGLAGLAAARRTPDHLSALVSIMEGAQAAHQSGDASAFADADLAFHRVVMDAAENAVLVALFEPVRDLLRDVRRVMSNDADGRCQALEEHQAIFEAIEDGDIDRASSKMEEHLRATGDRVVSVTDAAVLGRSQTS